MRIGVCLESAAHIAGGVIADAAFGVAGFERGGRPGAFLRKTSGFIRLVITNYALWLAMGLAWWRGGGSAT